MVDRGTVYREIRLNSLHFMSVILTSVWIYTRYERIIQGVLIHTLKVIRLQNIEV